MNNWKLKFVSIIMLLLTLTSCGLKEKQIETDWLPIAKQDETILYHQYEQKIFSFDMSDKNIASLNDTLNFYQFNFTDNNKIFTSGNSYTNNYSILELNNNELVEVAQFGDSEGIFPLATSNDSYFFIHTYYDDNGEEYVEKREVLKMGNTNSYDQLTPLPNVYGYMITEGVCIYDTLYFSAYESESNSYSIYSIEYNNSESKPQIVYKDLISPNIYKYNNELILSDNSYINIQDKQFDKGSENYIYNNSLIQIIINSEGDLQLTIISINDGKEYYSMAKNFGFVYNPDAGTMFIYGEGATDEITIK